MQIGRTTRKKRSPPSRARHIVLVLGDQLDPRASAFDGFDPRQDVILMAEVKGEAQRVWSHKARIALFLSAMRHHRDALRTLGRQVVYRTLDDPANRHSLGGELVAAAARLQPSRIILTEPGEHGVLLELERAAREAGAPIEIRPDRHFLTSHEEFRAHAGMRRQLRLEHFYREARRRHGILLETGPQARAAPMGGRWNLDAENRKSLSPQAVSRIPQPLRFSPDPLTQETLRLVERELPRHPGSLRSFAWPVTAGDAQRALEDFVARRLAGFGPYQDAMWKGEPFLGHSLISSSLNLKLLDPRAALKAAETAHRQGGAPLASTEGFVRQILGWREYIRGVYWLHMPDYAELNHLDARTQLPGFYWTGDVEARCLREVIGQTLEHGYAHHIQRLMVTGLYALVLGVIPRQVHQWYLAMYVDAVEWVELPNTLGMSQFADGGILGSKPYAATGKYIQRMSNYCKGCRYRPEAAVGEDACPFTTLYWDFLSRHQPKLREHPRMSLQVRNLQRLGKADRRAIARRAEQLREEACAGATPGDLAL